MWSVSSGNSVLNDARMAVADWMPRATSHATRKGTFNALFDAELDADTIAHHVLNHKEGGGAYRRYFQCLPPHRGPSW